MMSRSADWKHFEKNLAAALGVMEEDQFLVIAAKAGWRFVQFAIQGSFGVRAESISNHYLPREHRLTSGQIDALRALGWKSPTRKPSDPADGEGSPNFYMDHPRATTHGELAAVAVATLADVYGLRHPGLLEYKAFGEDGTQILIPTLGIRHERVQPREAPDKEPSASEIQVAVLNALRAAWEDPTLEFDEQVKAVPLRFGSAQVFVSVRERPLRLSLVSILASNIHESEQMLQRLNTINSAVIFARTYWRDGGIWAEVDLPAAPFHAPALIRACAALGKMADDLDDALQKEFGSRTGSGGFRPRKKVH